MTQPAGTFATNDAVGIREDLSDVIYNISPVETPFVNMIPHVKATQMNHEWQTDSLAAAVSTNAVIEGDDVTVAAATPTTRLGNITQLSHKHARVSSRLRAVNTAGRSDELIYQMEMKRARELRRDVETALLSNKPKVTGSDVLAPEMAGIGAWIATNDDFGVGGSSPTPVDGSDARGDGTQRAFTEDLLKNVLVSIYNAGGMPDVLMVGGFNRQIASSFSVGKTIVQKAEDPTLHATFSVYEGDFGSLKIVPNRFQRARDALVLQTDMWAFATLQDFHSFDLAKTGHADARVVAVEYTLEARNEAASGMVADLTTS
jgi:hypothetical protein